jgi:C-terminal processing protease CtpA/Prc
VAHLRSLTSADGFNPAFRSAMVGKHFALKYALAYGYPEVFRVTYQAPGQKRIQEAVLDPVSKTRLDEATANHNELSLKEFEKSGAALLTINSFAYYSQVDRFRTFLDSVFQVLDQKGIETLLLDLRGNGGGDPFCSSYLWAYLEPGPLPYFEDHYGRYDTLANPVPQPSRPFKGKLYTLIDGRCFSTTGHFVGLLKYHGVGKFVGTETGATYTCTGNATYPSLDRTRIMVGTARVMRYTAAVKDMDPTRGVIPDFPVDQTPQNMVSGRDAVLEYALGLANSD